MSQLLSNPYNLGQLTDLVKIGLVNWHKGAEMSIPQTLAVRSLYYEKTADMLQEEHSTFNESGFSHVSGDGEDYALTSDTQGSNITLTQTKRTVRRKITEDLIEFNRYPQVGALLRKTGSKLWRGFALDLTHKFTFAFSTSYTDRDARTVSITGADGAAMCASTHTLNNGDTFANQKTSRLSESSMEDMEDLGAAVVDQNGELAAIRYTTLVTGMHAATKHQAWRLTRQSAQVGSDLNDINVYQGQYRHVILPYLDTTGMGAKDTTKSRFWFLIDDALAKDDGNLIVSIRTMPDPETPTVDPDNNSVQFKGKMRYDYAHLDASFICGNNAV